LAKLTKEQLIELAAARIPDNTREMISAADVRQQILDLIDSVPNLEQNESGLVEYMADFAYKVGSTTVRQKVIYQALQNTTGPFKPADWAAIGLLADPSSDMGGLNPSDSKVPTQKAVSEFVAQQSKPFNGNRAITRTGAFLGITPGGTSESQFLENLFYPAVAPGATLTASNANKELGDPTATTTLNWSVTKNTNPITSIIVDGATIAATGSSQSGSRTGNLNGANKTFTMTVVAGGQATNASATITYTPAFYYGANQLNQADTVGVLENGTNINVTELSLTKVLQENGHLNYNFNCSGGRYIHILYPASLGNPELVRNGLLDFSAYNIVHVQIKDIFGLTRAYKLLTTGLQFGSSVNLTVTNT